MRASDLYAPKKLLYRVSKTASRKLLCMQEKKTLAPSLLARFWRLSFYCPISLFIKVSSVNWLKAVDGGGFYDAIQKKKRCFVR